MSPRVVVELSSQISSYDPMCCAEIIARINGILHTNPVAIRKDSIPFLHSHTSRHGCPSVELVS